VKALVISQPGKAEIVPVPEPVGIEGSVLLKVRIVGLCGSDLNSFRGRNPLVSFPRIPGHEAAATIVEAETENPLLVAGVDVALSLPTLIAAGVLPACGAVQTLANSMKPSGCNGTARSRSTL
jgi:threonine dehydrogenase-like Zn-dependent dehydrogenase